MVGCRFIDVTPSCIAKTPIPMSHAHTISRVVKRSDESLPLHAHAEAQLTYAASGMVQIHTNDGVWLVPPHLAAWVPPGVAHRLDIVTDAELWMVHWEPSALGAWVGQGLLDRAFALRVTPLLRSLLTESIGSDPASDKADLMLQLMLHELTAMDEAPTFLPLPSSPAARRLAELLLGDPHQRLNLDTLAQRAATSARTASRLFPRETGLTLKAWRQRARIVRAMEHLGRGDAPAKVARDVGFASTAAFAHAFRQVTTMTPTAFADLTPP